MGLSLAQTDQALFLRDRLTEAQFYKFEFKDALTAVSTQVIGRGMTDLHRKSLKYLSHECQSCLDKYPADKMANLCCHDATRDRAGECCKECAIIAFTAAIGQDVSEYG